MKWMHLLMAKCTECGKLAQWAGNNRKHCLGLAGHDSWQVANVERCPVHRTHDIYSGSRHAQKLAAPHIKERLETKRLAVS